MTREMNDKEKKYHTNVLICNMYIYAALSVF